MVDGQATYNLDFSLPSCSQQTNLSLHSEVLDSCHASSVRDLTCGQPGWTSQSEKELRAASSTELEERCSVDPTADSDHSWEVRKIVSRKIVDGEEHYEVEWENSWMSKQELDGARQLIHEYDTRLRCAKGKCRKVEQRSSRGTGDSAIVAKESASCRGVAKRPRGRPRKQQ